MGKKGKIALDKIACMKTTYVWVRSSRPEVFCKKDVLGNFTKFIGKDLCQSLFFNKVTEHLRWLLLSSGSYFCQIDSRYSEECMLRTNRYAKELGKLTLSTLSSIILCHKRGTHPSKILIGTKTLNTFHSTTPWPVSSINNE